MKTGFFISLILILFLPLVFASGDTNLTVEERADLCLNESYKILDEMIQFNFSVLRVNNSLKEARGIYDAQKILKDKRSRYDFSPVITYCDEVSKIRENAFDARDEISALNKFYEEFFNDTDTEINTTSVDLILSEINKEMRDERYEKITPLIDKAYEDIVNIKASQTTLNLFYKTTTRTLKDFFRENLLNIAIGMIILIVLFFIYKKAIFRWWIKRKIKGLEIRKETLKKLIQQTQKDYFEKGKLSEMDYEIKTKKFAELIRGIDRDIPLLREELVKISKKESTKDVFSEKEKDKTDETKSKNIKRREK